MLHEPASTREDRPVMRPPAPPPSRNEVQNNQLREKVAEVLMIAKESFVNDDPASTGLTLESTLVATFEGELLIEPEAAYDKLDQLLATSNHLPVFRETKVENNQPVESARRHTIHVLTGRAEPKPRPWWPNALLFVATIFSVLLVGANLALSVIAAEDLSRAQAMANDFLGQLPLGLPYAVSILLILGAHEMGHYFAARYHKLAVTLPYFIPMPFLELNSFGTMGAFIQLRQPMKNRKMLFDVGAAGPLAGLVFAVPILFIGLATAQVIPIGNGGIYEGDSLLYAFAKTLQFGHFLPDGRQDVWITSSQLAWAGWTGLLLTSLNLIPIGQLDGGHVLYALVGEHARKLYYPLMAIMVALMFVADVWLIWVVLLLLFGRVYATPLDMISPLDNRRRAIAVFALIVFVLIFVPMPLTQQYANPAPPLDLPRNSAMLPIVLPAIALQWVIQRRNRGRQINL